MRMGESWYRGTADSVYQNFHLVEDYRPDAVLVFGADHVYKMNVRQMVDFHLQQDAVATVACMPIPVSEATSFGIVEADERRAHHRLSGEARARPGHHPGRPRPAAWPRWATTSSRPGRWPRRCAPTPRRESHHDFGRNILPEMLKSRPRVRLRLQPEPHPRRHRRGRARLLARRRDHRGVLRGQPGPQERRAPLQPLQLGVADPQRQLPGPAVQAGVRRRHTGAAWRCSRSCPAAASSPAASSRTACSDATCSSTRGREVRDSILFDNVYVGTGRPHPARHHRQERARRRRRPHRPRSGARRHPPPRQRRRHHCGGQGARHLLTRSRDFCEPTSRRLTRPTPPPIALVVHGHFYQPPRENPWTDEVPREPSRRRPFHDWNERIHAECYRANAYARIYGTSDRIQALVNNYERTLLQLRPHAGALDRARTIPRTSARMRAGRRGAARGAGHGRRAWPRCGGIPSSPLLLARAIGAPRSAGGSQDFERRFGRDGRGHVAARDRAPIAATLEALIEAGIALHHPGARADRGGARAGRTPGRRSTRDTRRHRARLPLRARRRLGPLASRSAVFDGPLSREHRLRRPPPATASRFLARGEGARPSARACHGPAAGAGGLRRRAVRPPQEVRRPDPGPRRPRSRRPRRGVEVTNLGAFLARRAARLGG